MFLALVFNGIGMNNFGDITHFNMEVTSIPIQLLKTTKHS
ncbi:hypothetical protein SAMN03080602_01283 [Arenibacter troitsensis]|uniref:Uncharacterized protein n=1 Tax=Arenibacter troitsensis TaxID=188872 RepID=A0A1X7IYZ8_9FLAO|nr:hypothetical protein SAMN03080602_01283 [Arenibacter troitsensis]